MILSSYPGQYGVAYSPLILSEGYGWKFADLVVPSFLWLIGFSLSISITGRRLKGIPEKNLLIRVFYRSCILFGIGMALHFLPCVDNIDWYECLRGVRIYGVFQRIAIAYLLAAPVCLFLGFRGQLLALTLVIILYEFIWSASGELLGCDQSYRWRFFTTFPAMCYVLAGSLTYEVFSKRRLRSKHVLLGAALALILAGVIFSQGIEAFCYQRINASFFLLSTGIILFSFYLIDMLPKKFLHSLLLRPIIVLGMNPLVVYLLTAIIWEISHSIGFDGKEGLWVSVWELAWGLLSNFTGTQQFASLLMSLLLLGVAAVLSWLLASRGIIIKV